MGTFKTGVVCPVCSCFATMRIPALNMARENSSSTICFTTETTFSVIPWSLLVTAVTAT